MIIEHYLAHTQFTGEGSKAISLGIEWEILPLMLRVRDE